MDAAEYQEYIFGMLFLKRASDQFEKRYDQIKQENIGRGRSEEEAIQRAESEAFYANTFFVPEKSRWSYIRDELHENIGDKLNKALGELERTNSQELEGVLGHTKEETPAIENWHMSSAWTGRL